MRSHLVLAVLAAIVVSGACGDGPFPPTIGTLQVSLTTTGGDLPRDVYFVTVTGRAGQLFGSDSARSQSVGINGQTLFRNMPLGTYYVELQNVAGNCTVSGSPRRVVVVRSGETAEVQFGVTCVATTGVLVVTTLTTGDEQDADGYLVFVDGDRDYGWPIGVQGTIRIDRFPAGSHTFELGEMAPNCTVSGANPRTVSVPVGATTEVAFAVACVATGSLEVTARTSGGDFDANGYRVAIDDVGSDQFVPANGTVTVRGLLPGERRIALHDVAANCKVADPAQRTVTVPSGGTVAVTFDIACAAFGSLQVSVPTTGVDFDPNGYTVAASRVGGSGFASGGVSPNGTVVLSQLPAGDYSVRLEDVAANCALAGTNIRAVSVPSGGMAAVTFNVACAEAAQLAVTLAGDIHLVKSNGAELVQLTTHSAFDGEPAWSPDGSRIAFVSSREASRAEIYVMNADGTSPVRLTNYAGGESSPAWSPDGGKIAFVSLRDGNSEIYVMNADGSGPVRLTNTNNATHDVHPAWSPDGTKIAFVSNRDGNREIYVMNANGSSVTRLTQNTVEDAQPAWSPDGTKLVFSQLTGCDYYYGCDYDLIVMNADGSSMSRLPAWASDTDPAWSPDGRWIAFATEYCDYYYGCTYYGVQVLRLDSGQLFEVVRDAFHPAWRPR